MSITSGSSSKVSQLEAEIEMLKVDLERAEEAIQMVYEENQNLHCSTTISPKIGWNALERQRMILCDEITMIKLRRALTHENKP